VVDRITSLVESLGHWGILALMFLENVVPPVPSELIMPLGGFLAGQGRLNFALVVLAGAAGSVLGALPLYGLGRWVGEARLCRWAGRHGHWLAVAPDDVRRARAWFARHGGKAVLLGRLIPGVRSLVSVPAGTARMPLIPFLAYTAVGSAAWSAALAYAGRLLGRNYARVEAFVGPAAYVVFGGIVVAFVVRVVLLKRARDRRGPAGQSTCPGEAAGESVPSRRTDG
jgi:membrane protein DedA with SNARE-associated domain